MTLLISSTMAGIIFSIAALIIDAAAARKKNAFLPYVSGRRPR